MVLRLLLPLPVVLCLQGCLLFTTPVNEAPRIDIQPQVERGRRGVPLTVNATASDAEGGTLQVEWSTSMGPCPAPLDPARRPANALTMLTAGPATFQYTFSAKDAETVCVWAKVTDAQGAWSVSATPITSENRAPTAMIQVLAPTTQTSSGLFPLYSYFHLSASRSIDPDGDNVVDPMWRVTRMPPAATPRLVPCSSTNPSELVKCLDVGAYAGQYEIELTVGDGTDRSAPATMILNVDQDHPACVKAAAPDPATSPLVLDPIEARTFEITEILDDGAPLPTPADGAPATPKFAWKVRRNAGAWQTIVGYDNLSQLTLPGDTYGTGDVVDVSVTISDGMQTHLQPACDPRCPAGCPQGVQWTVEYR
jgi:hypothetical protein